MPTDSGQGDLPALLKHLAPEMAASEFVFCTVVEGASRDFSPLYPVGTFREAEGLTLILERARADGAGLAYEGVMRRITLSVHSSLEAVGLTAAVSGALAEAGISANVVAAYYHDHIFVPADRAEQALVVLEGLSAA
jgi:hypothetical protein